MRETILKSTVVLSMILCLACLGGCDSSSDSANGGGQGDTSGYTTADLAGRWGGIYHYIGGGGTNSMTIWFDGQGKVTAMKVFNLPPSVTLRGQVSVDPSGALNGVTVTYYGDTPGERLYWSKMKFVSPTQIKGVWLITDIGLPKAETSAASFRKQ